MKIDQYTKSYSITPSKIVESVEKSKNNSRPLYFALYEKIIVITDLWKYVPIGVYHADTNNLRWSILSTKYAKDIECFINLGVGLTFKHFCYGISQCVTDLTIMCSFWNSSVFDLIKGMMIDRISPHCSDRADIQVWMMDKSTVAYSIIDENVVIGETIQIPNDRSIRNIRSLIDSAMFNFEYNCNLIDRGINGSSLFLLFIIR